MSNSLINRPCNFDGVSRKVQFSIRNQFNLRHRLVNLIELNINTTALNISWIVVLESLLWLKTLVFMTFSRTHFAVRVWSNHSDAYIVLLYTVFRTGFFLINRISMITEWINYYKFRWLRLFLVGIGLFENGW